jgi:hypothetical protein
MRITFSLLFFIGITFYVNAQKILQIERYGSPKTKKIYIGERITYKLKNDEVWYSGVIEDLVTDKNLIALNDRYVPMDSIEAFRRPVGWSKGVRTSLYTFGAAWSGSALIGTLTDDNPKTHYLWSDAVVTATSWLTGWIIPKIFKNKVTKFGKKRRLRMLDLTLIPPKPKV